MIGAWGRVGWSCEQCLLVISWEVLIVSGIWLPVKTLHRKRVKFEFQKIVFRNTSQILHGTYSMLFVVYVKCKFKWALSAFIY